MKKLIMILTIPLCAALLFAACKQDIPTPTEPTSPTESTAPSAPTDLPSTNLSEPTTAPTIPTEPTTVPTDTTEPTTPILPEYQSGSIRLNDQNLDDYDFNRQYRAVYYTIYGEFFELLDNTQQQDFYGWLEESSAETNYGEFRNEMLLVSMIKRYNIPREDFDKAVEKYISNKQIVSTHMLHEDNEVPNADIIYTFDNEIINEYYRYE